MEVDRLKTDFLQRKEIQINQMDNLRLRMNQPYDVPDVQNYAQQLATERSRLDFMNTRIQQCLLNFCFHFF